MIENNPANMSSAFEMLLEEVEAEIDFVNDAGLEALRRVSMRRLRKLLSGRCADGVSG